MTSLLRQMTGSLRALSSSQRQLLRPSMASELPAAFVSSKSLGKRRALDISSFRTYSTGIEDSSAAPASRSTPSASGPTASSDKTSTQGRSPSSTSADASTSNSQTRSLEHGLESFDSYIQSIAPSTSRSRTLTPEAFEDAFRNRPCKGWNAPTDSTTGRSVPVSNGDVSTAYRLMSAVLNRNQIRKELRLGDRYEKPNQERRRKMSERHRRRFADMIRKKVQLVSTDSETSLVQRLTPTIALQVMTKRRRGE